MFYVYRPIFIYFNWEAIIMTPDLKAGVLILTLKYNFIFEIILLEVFVGWILDNFLKMGIYEGNQKFYQMDMIPDPKDCSFGRRGRTYDLRNGFLSHLNDEVEALTTRRSTTESLT